MAKHQYLVALGSNMRHHRHGGPRKVLAAALSALGRGKMEVLAASPVIETAPLGPSRRRYANGVALVRSKREPDEMLHKLRKIEHKFGRRRLGRAWGARVLDLDLVLWNGGPWAGGEGEESLVLPHPAFRARDFVLGPARRIAGTWRDPLTGLTINQLHARLTKPRPALR
ncbi:2-amino-4-hydroxy-6-hydroxymethyldihydropteridine diphosphokinase [Novosphingobium aerophilum]|uniref:2-amino-4-hydroxy-6- hydroxymethyldihydropteridine diphosphokinase n=1 Tax=Novosphingobium TaxID=165696 RepID=UPI0006C85134|nr:MULTISPECIES: 2-amino-4-hydroxy-6-hydroxymethyldihydropteridine diphosphokinase [unclassified Novosphingobium]KPH59868.1 2-amino-4-hydroxy-6-hydroxymethyldihydropteridine pyrophosphokinase [Novosphingobium sp. ST904]MPS67137.1 2-amino-4-hydroxy-6-hydroxymethyldihydropteridine diphosphokinase [Novosphingobium sp.]TCM39839.1 2-amino-4-hydroxy-6-hydroxymethyldihydropteridine diphosphokinase [Novosphingobium sp. ST904]WRT94043.1 2-amino-4-hydroxy-6-hydroxymethyldihydropteridine diphosphokinase [